MRKLSFTFAFLGFFLMGFGQTQISNICYSNSVNIFDMLEISFDVGASYTNPYDPDVVFIYAVFVSPTNEHQHVNAFYYEGYNFTEVYSNDHDNTYEQAVSNGDNGWRIRFTPNSAGNWSFVIHGIDANGNMQVQGSLYNTFTCNSVSNTNGFISKANNRFLKREVVKNGQKKM